MFCSPTYRERNQVMAKSKPNDRSQDAKMVTRGVHQHEGNMHKGEKKTQLKLGGGGKKGK